jgi:hypothetical protein
MASGGERAQTAMLFNAHANAVIPAKAGIQEHSLLPAAERIGDRSYVAD